MMSDPQPTDEQGTEPVQQPADVAERAQAEGTSGKKGPLYSTTGESRRVQMAIFSHQNPNGGETRYTTSICRRYKRKDDGEWVSSPYYDHPRDLEDVILLATEALRKINRYKGIVQNGDLT